MSSTNQPRRWPVAPAFEQGLLPVGEGHEIHYALYGNPEGEPVFFLHGGPGCGCDAEDATWFDPRRFLVVTHDQRGSGRSTPWAEICQNTPHNLVGDIERLRSHLRIDRPFLVFAGSWGTTLALLYAQAHPQNIRSMILRGVFTCGWKDQDYFYSEDGAARFSPAAWERLMAELPPGPDRIQERLHRLIEEGDEAQRRRWFAVLAAYEYSFFDVSSEFSTTDPEDFDKHFAEIRINCHYQAHRFFLEDEQILRNTGRIEEIPVTIVHGLRDVICPPMVAWRLHRRLPKSQLIAIESAGHLASDPRIERALLAAVSEWAERSG